MSDHLARANTFCERMGLRIPILLAPMAGASAPGLSVAVANEGGMGACGVLAMSPNEIVEWTNQFRSRSSGAFQLNIWIPERAPIRDVVQEARIAHFLSNWGPVPAPNSGDASLPNFSQQIESMLACRPTAISSVMGLFTHDIVVKLKSLNIVWIANVSTVAEAIAAEAAGAEVIVAQGAEAGGHRGCFNSEEAERRLVGSFSLIPAVADAVAIPVVATGGIADGRGVAAALLLGASAVQIGTGLLRSPEAKINPAWADAIGSALPENTVVSRVFSGRAGRSIDTEYVRAATASEAPFPAPYPVQRGLTSSMRAEGDRTGNIHQMQAWAGQSAHMARAMPARQIVQEIWHDARFLLAGSPFS